MTVSSGDDDRAGDRLGGDGVGESGACEDVAPAPAEIAELVGNCRGYVWGAVHMQLDLTPETLPVLDHYTGLARREVEARPQALPLLARVVGAYFGEVLRHHYRFFWRLPSADVYGWEVCAVPVLLAINPVGVAYDAICGAGDHDGPSSQLRVAPEDRAAVDLRLSRLPEVHEDDYYKLTTRLEAIEVAMEALRAEMLEAGTAEVEFDEGDYTIDF